jgi:hypothetical protein
MRSKPRPVRARPTTTLLSNFCPALNVCFAGIEVVGETVEDKVELGAVVAEEGGEDGVEADSVVPGVELVVPTAELEDSAVVTVKLVVPVVELVAIAVGAALVGMAEGGMVLKREVAPQSSREVPLGQQPALVQ